MSDITADPRFEAPIPPVDPEAAGLESSNLIVAEPDILARMVIAEYLRDCGYRVIECATADDVIAVLSAGRAIEIILAEVRLAGCMDGFALAQWVRDSYPSVDVILTSGIDKAADKACDICEEGPLERPYHPQEIVRRINLLRERRRTDPKE